MCMMRVVIGGGGAQQDVTNASALLFWVGRSLTRVDRQAHASDQ